MAPWFRAPFPGGGGARARGGVMMGLAHLDVITTLLLVLLLSDDRLPPGIGAGPRGGTLPGVELGVGRAADDERRPGGQQGRQARAEPVVEALEESVAAREEDVAQEGVAVGAGRDARQPLREHVPRDLDEARLVETRDGARLEYHLGDADALDV